MLHDGPAWRAREPYGPVAALRGTFKIVPAAAREHSEAPSVLGTAAQNKGFSQVFTLFNTHTPQVYADIDRTKAELLGVPIGRVFEALSVYMGSSYVNDFNILGRTYQVTAQADNAYRLTLRDVANLKTRNATGDMVPIGSVATFMDTTGPFRVPHYNLYPAAELQLNLAMGFRQERE
jgi:multidrug efflux pump subunit AcrB